MPSVTMPDPRRAKSGCPGCGRPVAEVHKPFCSQGCKDRDLLQWLSDGYRIPGAPADEDEEGRETGLDS
jgi:endogenous inhibitor of DNA gyrase (YacG/DUF329 family)